MNKKLKTLLVAISSFALVASFASPANANPTSRTITSTVTVFDPSVPTVGFTASIPVINTHRFDTITLGVNSGSMNRWVVPSSCSTTTSLNVDLTLCKVLSIKVNGVEDKSNWRVFYLDGGEYRGMRLNRNAHYSTTVGSTASIEITFDTGVFTAPAAGTSPRFTIDILSNGGMATDKGTVNFSLTGQSPSASPSPSPTPTASATPTTTPTPAVSTAPAKGTAAALATIPRASKAPKLKFDSSSNGLGKSAKKSLKKVADVAKDGYGVRVTGAAGMQAGVSRDSVRALAKKRAMEIRTYLIKQGVPKEDIVIRTKVFPIGKAPSTLVKVETLD
jgi:outer membrane protein OmpA-like peptidoglycan-associated protein